MPSVIAVDIDLGRWTAVHSVDGVLAHGRDPSTGFAVAQFTRPDVVLIEVAGPVMHHEESHSHRRWMIYNAGWAAMLALTWKDLVPKILVAPSTAWTQGFGELERDAIAGIRPVKYKTVTRKKGGKSVVTREPIWAEPHDVRECRCMMYFYSVAPKHWKPLDQYLKELVG
jgi:hypothetical protein